MKKLMLLTVSLLVAVVTMGTNPNYYQAMGEALGNFGTCKTTNDYQVLGNKFMVIANAEKGEWLPLYYHAQCYILMSFLHETPSDKKDEYLDVAQESINKMIEMAPQESEVYVLQGLCYTGRLIVSPTDRGQKYGQLSGQAIGRALGMEPQNPRAQYMKIANEMGTARFFGGDVSAYCDQANTLFESWDNYQPKSPIYPNWGKGQLEGLVNSCR